MASLRKIFDSIRINILIPEQKYIPTHLTNFEKYILYHTAKVSKATTVLEVGSYKGASAVCFAKGSPVASKIYCIDTWDNRSMSEGQYDTFDTFKNNTLKFSSQIIPVRGNSCDVISSLSDLKIDILFLDGDHSYDAVLNDFTNYFPLLRKDGYLLMHDVGWAEGVQRVVNNQVVGKTYDHKFFSNLFFARKK